MFNSINVYAAPISGVTTVSIFLRFGDPGASIDEWPEEFSPPAFSISDIPRFALVTRFLCEAAGVSRSRGVEVIFLGGC